VNDAEFRQAEKDWHSFVEQLTERLAAIDDTIPELPVKDVVSITLTADLSLHHLHHHDLGLIKHLVIQVFRIYRDVRFSPDPTPYKVILSCSLHARLAPASLRPQLQSTNACTNSRSSQQHG